jgi:hypothetical protein
MHSNGDSAATRLNSRSRARENSGSAWLDRLFLNDLTTASATSAAAATFAA